MGEEIYKFKSKVNSIPIPEQQLDIVIEQAIRKTKSKPKRYRYMIAIAATTLFLLFGSVLVSPTMANVLSQIPFLGNVLSYFDKGLEEVSKKGLVTTVGETAVDRDIPITITEVYYDNFRLVVGYSIPIQADPDPFETGGTEVEMLINDKKVLGGRGHESFKENELIGTIETSVILPDELKLELTFTEVLDKKGNWHFEIPVSRINDSLLYEINTVTKTEDYKFELFDIQSSPSGTRIHMELDTPLGQEEQHYSFLVFTESGEELKLIDYNELKTIPLVKFEKEVVKAISLYEPLKGSKLKIVPVFDPFTNPIPMNDLTIEVDLTKIKGLPIENDSTNIGLSDNWVDPETFMGDYMIEEAAEDLKIELGEYMKADMTILDLGFLSEFYKEQNFNSKTVLRPVALIEEVEYPKDYENAIIIYKTEDGKNHIFKAINKDDEWKIVESQQLDGKTIKELEKMYHEKYD